MEELRERLLQTGYFVNNEYMSRYCELIKDNRNTNRQKYKTQKHHIIPRCYFMCSGLEVDNSNDNIINLLYKDHVLAHYYLVRMFKSKESLFFNKCLNAFFQMVNNNKYNYETFDTVELQSVENYQLLYEQWKYNISQGKIGKRLTEEHRKKLSLSWNREKHITDEIRRKNSEANKGKKLSDETKKKISLARLGKSASVKGKIVINNGSVKKYINPTDFAIWEKLGWVRGGLRRRHSEETKKKISMSEKGRTPSRGMLGKKHSIEARKKMSLAKLNKRGKIAL